MPWTKGAAMIKTDFSVRPLREYLLVRRLKTKAGQVGSLIIPERRQERLVLAQIVAAGTGYVRPDRKGVIELVVRAGDIVLANDWAFTKDIFQRGETLYFMEEQDLHGVIDAPADEILKAIHR